MIYSLNGLAKLQKRLTGKRVIFIAGCFDILHEGHLQFIEKAKTYGDILVVGVLSDHYIEMRKKRKAVLTQKERARIIDTLKPVDHVVMTPYSPGPYPSLAVILILQPTVFLRCEAQHMYLPVKRELNALGTSLKTVRMRKVNSTSRIIRKITDGLVYHPIDKLRRGVSPLKKEK